MTVTTINAVEARPTTVRSLMLEGARDMTPMVIGVLPFAVAIGAAVGASSLARTDGLLSGPAILAGSAQLTSVEMLDAGTAPLVIADRPSIVAAAAGFAVAVVAVGLPMHSSMVVATLSGIAVGATSAACRGRESS